MARAFAETMFTAARRCPCSLEMRNVQMSILHWPARMHSAKGYTACRWPARVLARVIGPARTEAVAFVPARTIVLRDDSAATMSPSHWNIAGSCLNLIYYDVLGQGAVGAVGRSLAVALG